MTDNATLDRLAEVEVLAPAGGLPLDEFLRQRHPRSEPFSIDRLEAVAGLSERLMRDPRFRQDPACIAAAYWMRMANLRRLRDAHHIRAKSRADVLWVPVGCVFHVAPSNVDTLFLYSWVLAFLCGNANVVRLSQNQPQSVQALLETLSLTASDHPILGEQNRFVTYEHDAVLSGVFSQWCLHRIVWGGDSTVEALRKVSLNPHASERSFPGKFSFGVFKVSSYLALPQEGRDRLASGFFNDLFWFDQAACSSPQIVFWVGDLDQGQEAKVAFLDSLQSEATRRGHTVDFSQACNRLSRAFDLAIRSSVRVDLSRSALAVVDFDDVRDLDKDICGGGFLRVIVVVSPDNILPFLNPKDQTVTHFGFSEEELFSMARTFGPEGIDRMVPVGEALSFDPIWDGVDLIEDCLRRVLVEKGR